jgi:hypothetical protein
MVKQIISGILSRYDYAVMDAKVRIQLREDNLTKFTNLMREFIFTVLAEFEAADKRVTLEESNGGFWIHFNGKAMFRVGVTQYSERMEVVIDGERYLRFDGVNPYWIDNFAPSNKILTRVRDRLIRAFDYNACVQLEKQISQL